MSLLRVVSARGFVVLAQVEPLPVSSVSAIVRGAVAGVEVKRLASDKVRAADRKAKRARCAARLTS